MTSEKMFMSIGIADGSGVTSIVKIEIYTIVSFGFTDLVALSW